MGSGILVVWGLGVMGPTAMGNGELVVWGLGDVRNGVLVALGLGVMRPTIMRTGDLVAWAMGTQWHRDSFLWDLWGTRSWCGAMGTWFYGAYCHGEWGLGGMGTWL